MAFRRNFRRRFGRRRVGRRIRRVGMRRFGMRKRAVGLKFRGSAIPRSWRPNAFRGSALVSQGKNLFPDVYKTKLVQSYTYDPALLTGVLNKSSATIWAGNYLRVPNIKASNTGSTGTSSDSPNGAYLLLGSSSSAQQNNGAYLHANVYASKIRVTVFSNATSGNMYEYGVALVPSSVQDPLASIAAQDYKENPGVVVRLSQLTGDTSKKLIVSKFMSYKRIYPEMPPGITHWDNTFVSGESWFWNLYFFLPKSTLTFPGPDLTVTIDMTYYVKFAVRNNTPLGSSTV